MLTLFALSHQYLSLSYVLLLLWVPCTQRGVLGFGCKGFLERQCPCYWPSRTIAIATICSHSAGAPPQAQWSEEDQEQQQQQQRGGGKGGPGLSPWPRITTAMTWCWPPKPSDSHHASARWLSELGFVFEGVWAQLMSSTITFFPILHPVNVIGLVGDRAMRFVFGGLEVRADWFLCFRVFEANLCAWG